MNPPPQNAMMAALQQSRQQNPVSAPGSTPPAQAPGNTGDLQHLSSAVQDIAAKLDKVLEALSANYTGKEPDKTDEKENENEPASGY